MRIKVCYIVSNIDKALAFEWIAKNLDREKIELYFILLNPSDSAIEQYLKSININVLRINYFSKKNLPLAIFKIFWFLIQNNIKVVHCHLFDACMAGMTAAWFARTPQRIYTRHHSDLHHKYYPRAVWYDKLVNALSTRIIAITKNVKDLLVEKENVSSGKIQIVHHGFDLDLFLKPDLNKVYALKAKYNITENDLVIGVIARYTHWKGIQYIIPAFAELSKKYPNAKLVLANASGDYSNHIKLALKKLAKESYVEIEFEQDIASLYQLLNVYVHVPIDNMVEAFGQTYIEALASGVPSVFTLSGVACEFIEHEKNALVVDYKNANQITESIERILADDNLRNRLIEKGKESIQDKFSLKLYIDKLTQLYVE